MNDSKTASDADALSCLELLSILQSHLDGYLDDLTAQKANAHLEACRRCGMEASVYLQIKKALRVMASGIPEDLLQRLENFVRRLPTVNDA